VKLKLPEEISSPQDLKAVIIEIRAYARWTAHADIKKRVHAKTRKHQSEQPELSPAASALLHAWGAANSLSVAGFDQLISSLERVIEHSPVLAITLAAPPSTGLKKTLVTWCRDNIAPNVLVTFQFNSTLLGGLVVRSGSHIFDWSFRRQILENRQHFPEVLRRV